VVLVDAPGRGRTVHEAPEIDGIVRVPDDLAVGSLADLHIIGAEGPDLRAAPLTGAAPAPTPSSAAVVGDVRGRVPA
jgi:ribosomal protein S12 methylthiotransferase